MSLFINDAIAAAANTAAPQASPWGTVVLLAGFVVIFYFLLWRPQSKRAKEQRDLINSLQKGDEVVTSGGILGTITAVKDNTFSVLISENTEITLQKSAISSAVPKGTIKSS